MEKEIYIIMKARIKIALCGLFIFTAVVLSGNLMKSFEAAASSRALAQTIADAETGSPDAGKHEPSASAYIVGAYAENVAVYRAGQITPQTVTAIPLSSLCEVDRKSVETGIVVDSYEELLQLLEDFGS